MGALERNGKRLIAVVLACGWPNHRTWKWSDTQKLMNYGIENYHRETVGRDRVDLGTVPVENGQRESVRMSADVTVREVLLKDGDMFRMEVLAPDRLTAPVEEGELAGTVIYYLNDQIFDLFPVRIEDGSPEIDYEWCLRRTLERWLPGGFDYSSMI